MADEKTPPPPQFPNDPFEMYRRLWGNLGVPLPGMAMPTFDPAEVEKKRIENYPMFCIKLLEACISITNTSTTLQLLWPLESSKSENIIL